MAFNLSNQTVISQGYETPNQLSDQQNLINVLLQRPDFAELLYVMYPNYSLTAQMAADISFEGMAPKYTYDRQYKFFVRDRSDNPLTYVSTNGGTGAGGSTFNIICEENYGQPHMKFRMDPSGIELMLQGRPTQVGSAWQYPVKIVGTNQAAFVAPDPGVKFGSVAQIYSEASPRGYGNVMNPSLLTNYTTITRQARSVSGSGSSSTTWLNIMDEKYWVAADAGEFFSAFASSDDGGFLYQKEKNFWVGTGTVDDNGVSWVTDPDTGLQIYAGQGFIQQISNAMTWGYNLATFNTQWIMTTIAQFVQNSGLQYCKIKAHTGAGGYLAWQQALGVQINYSVRLETKADDAMRTVSIGQFVSHFQMNNADIWVYNNPVLSDPNLFTVADGSTGLPLSSYNFYLIEDTAEPDKNGGMINTIEKIAKAKMGGGSPRSLLISNVSGMGMYNAANGFDGTTFEFLSEDMVIVRKPNRVGKWIRLS